MDGTMASTLPDRVMLHDTKFTIVGYKDLINCKEMCFGADQIPYSFATCKAELVVPRGSRFVKNGTECDLIIF
jgi:hypothetical protein